MLASAYLPEYVRARVSAGTLFSMLREKPTIDSREDSGSRAVSADFLFIVMAAFAADSWRVGCGASLICISERSNTPSARRPNDRRSPRPKHRDRRPLGLRQIDAHRAASAAL